MAPCGRLFNRDAALPPLEIGAIAAGKKSSAKLIVRSEQRVERSGQEPSAGNYPPPMARVFAASGDDFEDGLEGVCAF
jgi:hypothetical protein